MPPHNSNTHKKKFAIVYSLRNIVSKNAREARLALFRTSANHELNPFEKQLADEFAEEVRELKIKYLRKYFEAIQSAGNLNRALHQVWTLRRNANWSKGKLLNAMKKYQALNLIKKRAYNALASPYTRLGQSRLKREFTQLAENTNSFLKRRRTNNA